MFYVVSCCCYTKGYTAQTTLLKDMLIASQNLSEQAIGQYLHSPGGIQGSSSEGSSDGPTDSSCQTIKTANNISGQRHVCIIIRLTDYSCSTLASMREMGWAHIIEQQLGQIKTAHMTEKKQLEFGGGTMYLFLQCATVRRPSAPPHPEQNTWQNKNIPFPAQNMSV